MSHPDYAELLDGLGASLPTECRENRFPYPGSSGSASASYCCSRLVHQGIAFGACSGMSIMLRLPENARQEAVASGGKQPESVFMNTQEWVDVTRMEYSDRYRLVRIAYDYAAELATSSSQTPQSEKTITMCPNCSQKLRAPNNLGELNLTCPKCRHSWLWSAMQS